MSKLLLDTNVLLDIAVPSRPNSHEALLLLGRIDEGTDTGTISAGSLKDFYYVMRKYSNEKTARGFVRLFMAILCVMPIDAGVCTYAIECDEPDFEDGIIRAIAETESVDFIISRDDGAFSRSRIKSLAPASYLELAGPPSAFYDVVDM